MEKPNNDSKLLTNWIPFPRKIASDYKNGLISRAEYLLYCHTRLQCNPYGIATVHLESLRDDVFGSVGSKKTVTINYVNQLLLSLRNKRYIYYKNRSGRTGSFEVRFDDFYSPDGKYLGIQHLFSGPITNKKADSQNIFNTEVTIQVEEEKQRLELGNNIDTKTSHLPRANNINRGYNNDTDNENKIENTDISVSNKKGDTLRDKADKPYCCRKPIGGFKPQSYETNVALEVATEVGDDCMDRYLALIREGKFGVLEKAYGEYQESDTSGVDNKAGYLNTIIMRLLKEQISKSMKV